MPTIKSIQCGSDHMTKGRSAAIDTLVVHYTGTTASAYNNAVYFSRNQNQGASAHYFVDDGDTIYQSVADSDTAWHAGNWAMNCRAIGIEVVSGGADFTEAEIASTAWLVQKLMKKHGISSSRVIRHYDVTGKRCPAPYVDASKWAALKERITGSSTASGGFSFSSSAPSGSAADLAKRVIAGEFGNGDARKQALGSRYDEVQAEVNRILNGGSVSSGFSSVNIDQLAKDVIAGKYGNGDARKKALGSNYEAVQKRVNEMLSGSKSSSGKSVDALAKEVIAGKWGNGSDRKNRLAAAGYDYNAVQKRVNQLLS